MTTLSGCLPAVQRDPVISTGSDVTQLQRLPTIDSEQFSAVPSPSGKKMLYVVGSQKSGKYMDIVVDLRTARRDYLGSIPMLNASWLPDGSGFVYSTVSAPNAVELPDRIRLYDLATHSSHDITPSTRYEYAGLSVAPNGRTVAATTLPLGNISASFAAALAGRGNTLDDKLAFFNVDGSGFTRTGATGYVASSYAWSPDSSWVILNDYEPGAPGGSHVLYEYNVSGSRGPTVASSGDHFNSASVSPDGAWVVYAEPADTANLYVKRSNGQGDAIQLTLGNTNNVYVNWSGDDYIYFGSSVGGTNDNKRSVWRLLPLLPASQ